MMALDSSSYLAFLSTQPFVLCIPITVPRAPNVAPRAEKLMILSPSSGGDETATVTWLLFTAEVEDRRREVVS